LEKRAEQALPGSEGVGGKGSGAGGRNGPNNVCTCEYMNKEKKISRIKSKYNLPQKFISLSYGKYKQLIRFFSLKIYSLELDT
jgi:hypothetical protein